MHPERWVQVRPEGLYVVPGDFYVDPIRGVARAVVTHGHSDHSRAGHQAVLATAETLAIARARLGEGAGVAQQAAAYGEVIRVGEVDVTLLPAGHVLGSAQVLMEHKGGRIVVSGDYKRRADPTCTPFEPVHCDVFVTEATFGLPVFRHPPVQDELRRLLHSVELFPERCHVVGAYTLGKAQRLIAELRLAGWDKPIFVHGALAQMNEVYRACGIDLGELRPATAGVKGEPRKELEGAIVVAPPSAIADRWARRLPDPVICQASGWMRVKQRAKQGGIELPLVISDHADWDELLQTLDDVAAPKVWITHGREEALQYAARAKGYEAEALRLVGYDEEGA
ncbi:MAG TPA: ligase-associated DNA damage response exonuclease [Geminicoccus sp.]|uniref:ligase-associated DNA damage response exonuclease n=1 Tax=Geminicoccus sp. TaxID=2024832 RepID=UPI002E3183F7|nr:ligase-associated DNA damage response exonuclease [Geminicoccus sp.]HEX2528475.1 ligase-associated DNA damage response exonuclease [Geminicoccus sp.]